MTPIRARIGCPSCFGALKVFSACLFMFVLLCDTNDLRTREALELFPKAKTYFDWRRCLDQKDVEAVVICTADHHHAFIANWALNRGQHVYCEKPLGITVEEVRTVRANYLSKKAK